MNLPESYHRAWVQISENDNKWPRFDLLFDFHPAFYPPFSPAIVEPPGSLTVDLSPIFGDKYQFQTNEARVNSTALMAMVDVFPQNSRLIALDWQHDSYWFSPHQLDINTSDCDDSCPILPFPNGDYSIFLNEDMTQGTFGHPWEQTLCIFGPELVAALAPKLTAWLPVKRRN